MKRYDLFENTREVTYKNRKEIKVGCTFEQEWQYPCLIESFDAVEDALKELAKYESSIQMLKTAVTYFDITEYYVQENEYDEDGEWSGGGDIVEFSKFDEKALEIMADF